MKRGRRRNSTVGSVDNNVGPRPVTAVAREELSAAQRAVLDTLVDLGGPRTVAEIAGRLGQHANTVREHLEALVTAEVATRSHRRPAGRGRPAALYRPTLAATPAGPEYAVLTEALITYLSEHWPPAQRRAHAVAAGRAWGQALRRHHQAKSESTDPRTQLTELLESAGFGCRTTVLPDGTHRTDLVRCPVLELAREHPEIVCGSHLGMVQDILENLGAADHTATLDPFAAPGACLLDVTPPR